MSNGITINNSVSPRELIHNGEVLAAGGSVNNAGLYAAGDKLYLDGTEVADGSSDDFGLRESDGKLVFNGVEIGQSTPTPPDPPEPPTPTETDLWIPPMQAASTYNKYNYRDFITEYDKLMKAHPNYVKKYEYREVQNGTMDIYASAGGTVHTVPTYQCSRVEVAADVFNQGGGMGYTGIPLYHYEFTPEHYTKTYFLDAGCHGNEHDAPQVLLRIMQILCDHTDEAEYARLKPLRDNVRFIVIPVVNPWGHDAGQFGSMTIPYNDWDGNLQEGIYSLNVNRNEDERHSFSMPGSGNSGNYPFQVAENRHIKHIFDLFGARNIDYAVDMHDGEDTERHFWWGYNADGANAEPARKLLADIITYENELIANGGPDHRVWDNEFSDEYGWVHPNVCDNSGYANGTLMNWWNNTLGIFGSVVEYLGGYWGYGFTSEQMTRSLRMRANLIIYMYEMIRVKPWQVNEAADAKYFQFDYPISMTRQGLMRDVMTPSDKSHNQVSWGDIYGRWDKLVADNPNYVAKSASLGTNYYGSDVFQYTIGNGPKKVLFIGGTMRWGGWESPHKETEFGIYLLAEYLCDSDIVNQSRFLQRLKSDYTIVVIPCIDTGMGDGTGSMKYVGLNAAGLTAYAKWRSDNNVCKPTDFATAGAVKDVPIFMAWISANSDALILVSGGEDTSGYTYERPKYSTDYNSQFIVPRTQPTPAWFTSYCDYLEDERGEDTPDVENTAADANGYGLTCGDYAYDNYGIPAYFINLRPGSRWTRLSQYMAPPEGGGALSAGDNIEQYRYRAYETGRRIAHIANMFLMAGGDIAPEGGLVEKGGDA